MSIVRNIGSAFSRCLQIRSALCSQIELTNWRGIHSRIPPLCFQFTHILNAEPLKKKRRVDPSVLKDRAEKKIRRIQRDIRKLEKVAKRFKPIAENQIPKKVVRDSERLRLEPNLSEPEMIERALLRQDWAIYKRKQHVEQINEIERLVSAQERAMDALADTSLELYEQALQPDPMLIPFKMTGPTETPPLEGYIYPDGDYTDVSQKYLPIMPSDPKKLKKLQVALKKKK